MVRVKRRSRTNCAFLIPLAFLILLAGERGGFLHAQTREQSSQPRADLGQSAIPLNGPWKFQIHDSPLDPVSHEPIWAEADFDDSQWESVSISPESGGGAADEDGNVNAAGWTAKGHPEYWGYAWYRIKVQIAGSTGSQLGLAGPTDVDDVYQIFVNGRLVGSFGNFRGPAPTAFYNQPAFFPLPENKVDRAGSTPVLVVALRVWMSPMTLASSEGAGGLRSPPLIGESNSVFSAYRIERMELIRSYSSWAIEAVLWAVMAVVAFSLILFDRSDRVYVWIGSVFLCTAAYLGLGVFDVWTQRISLLEDVVLTEVVLGPLAYAGWLIVWWIWFGRRWPARLPGIVAVLTLIFMIAGAIAKGVFYPAIPHQVVNGFEACSVLVRLLFLALLARIAFDGIRRQGIEGWLVLPTVPLLGIGIFHSELTALHIRVAWYPFGVRFTIAQIANLLLAGVLAVLLLRRLLDSVRRQREISFSLKQAQLQSDFVAAVSHEFRSPLTTLRSITELLAHNRISDESRRRQSYGYLERETSRLQRLVEDLLDFGRMESGRKQYRIACHDAFDLVRGTLAEFAEQAEANGFRVESDFSSPKGEGTATVRVDEEAMRRAVRNLLENAMKYSPECRTIWVSGSLEGNSVCISVRDKGMGIGAEEQQAIFQKFVRGDAAKQAGIKGTGIGLAMVHQIADAMHGGIRLQSEIGVGSTFTLVLPRAEK
jgi:signal transduction histidine kinase